MQECLKHFVRTNIGKINIHKISIITILFFFFKFNFTALSETGIRDLFDVVIGNEDYENAKPSPDAFLTAANRLSVSPKACWAFEDS